MSAKHISPSDAREIIKGRRRIDGLARKMAEAVFSHLREWSLTIPVNPFYSGAASVLEILPGMKMLIIDWECDGGACIFEVSIKEIDLPWGREPIVVANDGSRFALPDLSLLPQYSTGEWRKRVPLCDTPQDLVSAIEWLARNEHLQLAEKLQAYLEEVHGVHAIFVDVEFL